MTAIVDDNLRLALLDEIQDDYDWVDGHRDAYESARDDHPEWPSWEEIEENEHDVNPSLQTFLLGLDVPAAKLAEIRSLTLDGDRSIYGWLGGEGWWEDPDLFRIGDLSGLEQCVGLEYLLLGQGIVQGASLRPLASLSKLRELHVCALTGLTEIDVVLGLPALEKLVVVNIATSRDKDEWERVIALWEEEH